MISLIRSGFFEDFDSRAAVIWAVLFLLGAAVCRLMKKRNARLVMVCASLALLGICDGMVLLSSLGPVGDGYAVLGDVGLIGASFLLPFGVGVVLTALLTAVCNRK